VPNVCFYFQLHQPFRLKDYSLFELGKNQPYFSAIETDENREVFQKVAHKSYLPMLSLLLKLVQKHPDFCFALSCSGVFLDQAEWYQPKVLELLKKLLATGQVEILSETYYHSLASLYSPTEFRQQVTDHRYRVQNLFGLTPTVFRNTELIYSNDISYLVADLGFQGILTEGVARYLHGRSLTQVFKSVGEWQLPILLKHAQLSDDIAFRFSNRDWQWYPLTVERYLEWVEVYGEVELVNLFMDFETFGEHQWADTGIFEFFAEFVQRFLEQDWNKFVTPIQLLSPFSLERPEYVSELTNDLLSQKFEHLGQLGGVPQWPAPGSLEKLPVYDVPKPISWADVDRDLTAWVDSPLQQDTLAKLYELETEILQSGDQDLISDWRKLQTSDHFYYMCTKWAADGDVHAYFSPYQSPYEAYRRYSIVLADVKQRVGKPITTKSPQ